jgi:hypothetical protein
MTNKEKTCCPQKEKAKNRAMRKITAALIHISGNRLFCARRQLALAMQAIED